MVVKVGFLINPIAGMGGRVGLKGTDGDLYKKALELGAKPIAEARAKEFLECIRGLRNKISIYTASGRMGERLLEKLGFRYNVVHRTGDETTRMDTIETCKKLLDKNVDIIIFAGGDGTARDVYDAIKMEIPVIAIPTGVKMYSSVFTLNPKKACELLIKFLKGEYTLVEREVLDIDEEAYRKNILRIRLYGYLKIIYIEGLIQGGKTEYSLNTDIEGNKLAIAKHIVEEMDRDTLYLTGPGTTVKKIHEVLHLNYTLLGVDAIYNYNLVGLDLNEKRILKLLDEYNKTKIIVSPIGGQGFILGRGNQVLSDTIIKRVGKENIIIVATKDKIKDLRCLYVDTGDSELDKQLHGYVKVIVDYREYVIKKICI